MKGGVVAGREGVTESYMRGGGVFGLRGEATLQMASEGFPAKRVVGATLRVLVFWRPETSDLFTS